MLPFCNWELLVACLIFLHFYKFNIKINCSFMEYKVLGTFFQGVRLTGGEINLRNGEHYNSYFSPNIKLVNGIKLENQD